MQEMMDEALHHAFINQASVMSNTVHNAVVNTLMGGTSQGYRGSAFEAPRSMPFGSSSTSAVLTQSAPQPIQVSVGIYNTPLPPYSAVAPLSPTQLVS